MLCGDSTPLVIFSYSPPVPSCPCDFQYTIQTPVRAGRTDILAFETLGKRCDVGPPAAACACAERHRHGMTSSDTHPRETQNKWPVSCEVHFFKTSPKPRVSNTVLLGQDNASGLLDNYGLSSKKPHEHRSLLTCQTTISVCSFLLQ